MSDRDLYVHHSAPGKPGAPLLLLFHGTGGDETQLLPFARQVLPDAAIVAPRGDVDEHGALRFFRRKAEGLYDMPDLAARTEKMAEFIAAHVAEQDPSRVIGLGYSNGANILASVIFAHRNLFDDAVLMHPLISRSPDPGPVRTRVLITAGQRDPICTPPLTRQLEGWFAENGAAATTHWHPGGHEVDPSEIAAIARFLG
jgi:phospholipase/carboxylesterase